MYGFRVDTQIAAPVDRVFAAATDFSRASETIQGIKKVELLTDGPVGHGTRFRETRIMFGREATEVMEVTGFEPPHRYTLGAESHGCRYHTEWIFSKAGENATRVEMVFDAVPTTTLAKIMSFMMKPLTKKMVQICAKDLDDLKESIET